MTAYPVTLYFNTVSSSTHYVNLVILCLVVGIKVHCLYISYTVYTVYGIRYTLLLPQQLNATSKVRLFYLSVSLFSLVGPELVELSSITGQLWICLWHSLVYNYSF